MSWPRAILYAASYATGRLIGRVLRATDATVCAFANLTDDQEADE